MAARSPRRTGTHCGRQPCGGRKVEAGSVWSVHPGVSKTRRAQKDLAEIAAHYGEESLELELRFLYAIEKTLDGLLAMPQKGARRDTLHPTLQDLRVWPVPEFPAILVYDRSQADGIHVIRLLHSSRDMMGQLTEIGES